MRCECEQHKSTKGALFANKYNRNLEGMITVKCNSWTRLDGKKEDHSVVHVTENLKRQRRGEGLPGRE